MSACLMSMKPVLWPKPPRPETKLQNCNLQTIKSNPGTRNEMDQNLHVRYHEFIRPIHENIQTKSSRKSLNSLSWQINSLLVWCVTSVSWNLLIFHDVRACCCYCEALVSGIEGLKGQSYTGHPSCSLDLCNSKCKSHHASNQEAQVLVSAVVLEQEAECAFSAALVRVGNV